MNIKDYASKIEKSIIALENYYEYENYCYEQYSEMENNIESKKTEFLEKFGQSYDEYSLENTPMFLNVYEVTRHFGGHEEGGWWYDWYNCIEVFPVRNYEKGKELEQWLLDQHKNKAYGDISSVLGGLEIIVRLEDSPKKYETKERPYYE